MHSFIRTLLFLFCFQQLVPVYAESGSLLETSSGSVVPVTGSGSIDPLPEPEPEPLYSPLRVVINEVMWMGSDLSTADEWIELAAVPALTGAVITDSLTLENWTVVQVSGATETVIAQLPLIHIGSGQHLVIANNGAGQSRLKSEPSFVTTSMSLPNTKLHLRLRDAAGIIIDEVDDEVGAPFAGSNPSTSSGQVPAPKASMERIDPRLSGVDKVSWRTASTSCGFDQDISIMGTPGCRNGSSEVIESPSSSVSSSSLPSNASSSSKSSISSIAVQPLHMRVISELLSDPTGSDDFEWIELTNPLSVPLDLTGWKLQSGSKTYTFPAGSGSLLGSGQVLLLEKAVTGLSLVNAGGRVTLSYQSVVIDELVYPDLPEGVSYGRSREGVDGPICAPTPGALFGTRTSSVLIEGLPPQGTPVGSLNLKAVASGGTLMGAQCTWDFGDGFRSASCNPPSHAMKTAGTVTIRVSAVDYCGNTLEQSAQVFVQGKTKQSQKTVDQSAVCVPHSFSGVSITEVFPKPSGPGEDEWIEVRNDSAESVGMCGWGIDDSEGGSKPWKFPLESLEPGQYRVVRSGESKIGLNNDADSVRLIAPVPSGGTGVLMSVLYHDAPEDESWAVREDGQWLWTNYETPDSENRFQEVDAGVVTPTVVLSAALPNPKGEDAYGEWIALKNLTLRPQWLNGWRVETESGAVLDLQGTVLEKNEILKLSLENKKFVLPNSRAAIRLIDSDGQIRSVLSWEKGKEDQVVHSGTGDGVVSVPPAAFGGIYSDYMNMSRALTEEKKYEYKNDTDSTQYIAVEQKQDIYPLLLQLGLAFVPGGSEFSRRLEFEAYERIARQNLRGLWSSEETAMVVDAQKVAEAMDARVVSEGLVLIVDPPSGVVGSGALLTVSANVPSDIYVTMGSGYRLFTGSLVLDDESVVSVFAEYRMRTMSGEVVRSNVTTREYTLMKNFYPQCLSVSEVYPSPLSGESEWVELENRCEEDVSLLGWSIDDAPETGSKSQMIEAGIVIPGGSRRVLSGSLMKLALNNGGDAVALFAPNKKLMASLWYPSIKKGYAYALNGEKYCVTTEVTPEGENICKVPVKKVAASKSRTSKTSKWIAGVGTTYMALVSSTGSLIENTKIDQEFSLYKGLSDNKLEENKGEIFVGLYAVLLIISAGMLVWMIAVCRRFKRSSNDV